MFKNFTCACIVFKT